MTPSLIDARSLVSTVGTLDACPPTVDQLKTTLTGDKLSRASDTSSSRMPGWPVPSTPTSCDPVTDAHTNTRVDCGHSCNYCRHARVPADTLDTPRLSLDHTQSTERGCMQVAGCAGCVGFRNDRARHPHRGSVSNSKRKTTLIISGGCRRSWFTLANTVGRGYERSGEDIVDHEAHGCGDDGECDCPDCLGQVIM